MKHEIEVKLRLPVSAILDVLKKAGFQIHLLLERHFEDNWLLGGSDGKVPGKRAVLRVRSVNGRGTLTYKAEPPEHEQLSAYKIRTEIETEIAEPEAAMAIFRELGYQPWFRYQKYRTVYSVNTPAGQELEIMSDETPLGDFVELEGPEQSIAAVLQVLNVDKSEHILESYLALQLDACRQKGKSLEDLVFPQIQNDPAPEERRNH